MRVRALPLSLALAAATMSSAFIPASLARIRSSSTISLLHMNMMDPASIIETTTSLATATAITTDAAATWMDASIMGTNPIMAFADQGQNLAGIFFQASLLPYLAFLYFLSFRGNRIPALGNFGFQFVLIFVAATIPSGIISRAAYGDSLANVDWLHGGAEALLTIANICLVLGFKNGASPTTTSTIGNTLPITGQQLALASAGLFAAACALGPGLGAEVHSPFLLGVGNLSPDITLALPWVCSTIPFVIVMT